MSKSSPLNIRTLLVSMPVWPIRIKVGGERGLVLEKQNTNAFFSASGLDVYGNINGRRKLKVSGIRLFCANKGGDKWCFSCCICAGVGKDFC